MRYQSPPRGRSPGLWVAGLVLLTLAVWFTWDQTRIYATPERLSNGYQPALGDVVFQSLPYGDMAGLIEDTTDSPLSHCGIVALDRGRWVVVEAIGPVKETPLESWIRRGRDGSFWAYRLRTVHRAHIPAFIAKARHFLGRPYDTRFRLDDTRIYCSELVYKAYQSAAGEALGVLARLDSLDWQPQADLMRRLEGGALPMDRLLITPRDLARAGQLERVFGDEPAR